MLAAVAAMLVIAQSQSPARDVVIGDVTQNVVVQVSLLKQPKDRANVTAKVRNDPAGVRFLSVDSDFERLTAAVTLEVASVTRANTYIVDVYERGQDVLGSETIRFRRRSLSDPTIRIWPVGATEADTPSRLVLPLADAGVHLYNVRVVASGAEKMLFGDRLRPVGTERLKVESVDPTGPDADAPSSSALYLISVDASNLPKPGPLFLEISNPDRTRSTLVPVQVVSDATPNILRADPRQIAAGAATTITLYGSGFDDQIRIDPASDVSGSWTIARESGSVVKLTGTPPANINQLRLAVLNANGRTSNVHNVDVNAGIGGLSVLEMQNKDVKLRAGTPTTVTIEPAARPGIPVPTATTQGRFIVVIGRDTANHAVGPDGRIRADFTPSLLDDAPPELTEVKRHVSIVHVPSNSVRWQQTEAVTLSIPPRWIETSLAAGGPFLPGTEREVNVLGRHFSPALTDVRVRSGTNVSIKAGSVTVKPERVSFVAVAQPEARGEVSFDIIHDGTLAAGRLEVVPLPRLDFVELKAGKRASRVDAPVELIAGGGQNVILQFSPSRTGADSPATIVLTTKVIRDTIGEGVVVAEREVLYDPAGTDPILLFTPRARGLKPGQRVFVRTELKGHPTSRRDMPVTVEREGLEHLGLLLGAVAYRGEVANGEHRGDASRNATLSDLHIGAEFIPLNSSDFGLGAGITLFGEKSGDSTLLTHGYSLSFRYSAITLLVGRGNKIQSPVQPAVATSDSVRMYRPKYFMIGASLGADGGQISSALSKVGGIFE